MPRQFPGSLEARLLKSLDVLIGVSFIMVVVSMVVTMVTQFVTSTINSRGRHLKKGLADLLQHVAPTLSEDMRKNVATHILTHPLIREVSMFSQPRLGSVVHREEFIKLLMETAAGEHTSSELKQGAAAEIANILAANGITDPKTTLSNIRLLAMKLEQSNPELSNNARQSVAILHEAESTFVARINSWFDQTMDRVKERFTVSTRLITFASALTVALVLQLDLIKIVNRLSVDDALRAATVSAAQQLANTTDDKARQQYIATNGLVSVPSNLDAWKNNWGNTNWAGVLLSSLLLTLGAPFWFNLLKQLLQLRSVLASKDDKQREERQSAQAATDTPVGPAPVLPAIQAGERGDLAALG